MALVLLRRRVSERFQTGEDHNGEPEQQFVGWDVEEWHFNTFTEQDEASTYFTAGSEPPAFELAEGAEVHAVCQAQVAGSYYPGGDEFTRWSWSYSRYYGGTLPPEPEPNAKRCGYVPPTCNLGPPTVSVSGTTATITATGNRGQLRYSRDAGLSLQSSNVFAGLQLGQQYTVRVVDQGVADCFREVSFVVRDQEGGGVEPEPEEPPTNGEPPVVPPAVVPSDVESLSYALSTVFENLVTGAFRTVRLELWMETAHFSRDYRRVVELEKRADEVGAVSFRLDRMLADQLQAEPLNLLATQTAVAGQVLKNYFCRWRTVNAATGALGPWTNRPLRTALLSGLPLPGGWLTTHPAVKHVLMAGQHEFLFFMTPPAAAPDLTVHRVLEIDNLPPAIDVESVVLDNRIGGRRVLLIPVFNTPLPSGARRLIVSVVDDEGQVLGQARTFELSIEPEPAQKQFLFATPVGGVDTLLTRGAGQTTLDVKSSLTERGTYPGQDLRTPLRAVFDLDETRTFRQATGWLTAAQQVWLQTFMLSRRHWLVAGGQLEPVLITGRKMTYGRTDPRTEGLSFDYELTSATVGWSQLINP